MSQSNLQHYSHIKFRCKATLQNVDPKIIKLMRKKQNWFMKIKMDVIFSLIEELNVQKISLENQGPQVIKNMASTSFYALVSLSLVKNNIVSIEYLQHLDAPNMKSLNLANNSITDIRTLRKCSFNHLTSLNLSRNPILNLNYLIESKNKLQKFIMEGKLSHRCSQYFNNYYCSLFAKIESPQLRLIQYYDCEILIRNNMVNAAIQKRYHHLLFSRNLDL